MNDKLKGIIAGVGTLMELGCIAALAAIGLKRNNDAYEAEMKCIDLELANIHKDVKISMLEYDMKQLKEKYEIEEEA
jgi:hypothetical protein